MSDERLAIFRGERDAIRADEQEGVHQPGTHWHVVHLADAVDEIDRLRAEVAELRERMELAGALVGNREWHRQMADSIEFHEPTP